MKEIKEGLFDESLVKKKLNERNTVFLKGRECNVCIGEGFLIKVATNIGVAEKSQLEKEKLKLHRLNTINYAPDILMDHTIVDMKMPFWKIMVNSFSGPVGTLPHYLAFKKKKGIDENELLDRMEEMAEKGVSFFTIHPTATEGILQIAKKTRVLPTTARGGGLVLLDVRLNNRKENVFEKHFISILQILKRNKMALSIGATFRPSNIFEALDEAHLKETELQSVFIAKAKEYEVDTIMEGIGHIRLSSLPAYAEMVRKIGVPFMPLGPIPTDASISFDHVASAIGASHLGLLGIAKIFHSVTREEHTGNVPSLNSVLEGLKAAKVAAHSVNICLFPEYSKIDKDIAITRTLERTCFINQGLFRTNSKIKYSPGCKRCNNDCPLTLNY